MPNVVKFTVSVFPTAPQHDRKCNLALKTAHSSVQFVANAHVGKMKSGLLSKMDTGDFSVCNSVAIMDIKCYQSISEREMYISRLCPFCNLLVYRSTACLLIHINVGLTAEVASNGTTTSLELTTAVVEPKTTTTQPITTTVPPTAPTTAATVKPTTTIVPATITNDAAVPATQQGAVAPL